MKPGTSFQKDTGWSWVILWAAFCCQIIIFGLLLCFGIYFVTLLEYFQCTKSQVAVVGSVAYGTKCLTGLLASVLYRKFGCRIVVMSGGLIAATGCFLSYFATDLTHLCITYGFINGFGLGLVFTPTLGILPDYFDRHRYFATAFVTVGSAVGTLLFQPIFLHLISTYGWRGSMLINSGFCLHIVLFGSLMKSRSIVSDLKFASLLEISLLKSLKFWFLMADSVLWGGAVFIVFSMANNLMISHGIEKSTSAFLASLIGLGNTIGRLCASLIGNFKGIIRKLRQILKHHLSKFSSTEELAGVIMDLFGVAKLVNGIGYSMFAVGIGGISIPPLAGAIADRWNVEGAYYVSSIMGLLAASLCFANVLLKYLELKRETQNQYALEETEVLSKQIPEILHDQEGIANKVE